MSERKHYTPEEKVKIVREHLENQISIGQISEKYGINPNSIYKWKKELFEGGIEIFRRVQKKDVQLSNVKIKMLETKIKEKDSLIAEIVEENVKLKKNTVGEI